MVLTVGRGAVVNFELQVGAVTQTLEVASQPSAEMTEGSQESLAISALGDAYRLPTQPRSHLTGQVQTVAMLAGGRNPEPLTPLRPRRRGSVNPVSSWKTTGSLGSRRWSFF